MFSFSLVFSSTSVRFSLLNYYVKAYVKVRFRKIRAGIIKTK